MSSINLLRMKSNLWSRFSGFKPVSGRFIYWFCLSLCFSGLRLDGQTVLVSVIQARDGATFANIVDVPTNSQDAVWSGGNEATIETLVNTYWGPHGIQFEFQNAIQTWNDSDALDPSGVSAISLANKAIANADGQDV